jgi:hypothetical protein
MLKINMVPYFYGQLGFGGQAFWSHTLSGLRVYFTPFAILGGAQTERGQSPLSLARFARWKAVIYNCL